MTSGLRRALEAVAGIALVTLAVAWLSGGCGERVAPGEAELPAAAEGDGETAVVEAVVGPSVEWASGEVASARHTAVAARVLARIEEVRVRAGSAVEEGDVLVVLDARDLEARTREATEALRAAQARLDLAERDHARADELVRTGVAPQRRLDEATSELRSARADVAGRREAVGESRTAASFAELRSPVSGRVVDRLAEPGDTAVPGRPLLRIYDPTLLRVEAPVRESLAVGLTVGDTLRVDVPALGAPVEGRIDEIVPFAERGARTLLVKVSLPRTDARLFAGMFARVAIPAGERTRLLVPAAAVERVGQLEFVTVARDGAPAERRLVTTGGSPRPGVVEVLSGLTTGEQVRLPAPQRNTRGRSSDVPLASSPSAEAETGPVEQAADPDVARAEAAVASLRRALAEALQQAISSGDLEAAVDVCREEAPRVAERVSAEGVFVGRTSDRLRNPKNAPEPWMVPLLAAYQEGRAEGASTVDLGERGLGYVEPITVQLLCPTCHGVEVAAPIRDRIRALYPADEATGYEVGDFRGLFWARVPRDPS